MQRETVEKLLAENQRIYNEVAREFSRTREGKLRELEPLARLVKDGDRVLDVGSGSGRLFELLKNRQVEYFGIDASEEMIKLCKEKFSTFPQAHFENASALKTNFPNESFDAIYVIATLHHIPSHELQLQALKEFYRLLKLDGKLIMTNWYWWRGRAIVIILKYWLLKWFLKLNLNALCSERERTKEGGLALTTQTANLDFGDIFVPWDKAGLRYYHSFRKKELKKLLVEAEFKNIHQYLQRKSGDHWGKRVNLITITEK